MGRNHSVAVRGQMWTGAKEKDDRYRIEFISARHLYRPSKTLGWNIILFHHFD
jgi:hypothetical protein